MAALATSGFVSGMDDYRLKPTMLRSVVRDRLPDGKRPVPSLDAVSSHVQDHRLLSEHLADPADRKLVDAWRSAVDIWVERIVLLASSSALDECRLGIHLLGLTCKECCSDRFQSSYAIWFPKLMKNIQSPSTTHVIEVSCASLNDFFKRLVSFSNLKKDTTLYARKVKQLALQMLNADAGETYWNAAANLLYMIISAIPSSVQHHYDNVEAALTSKIMAAKFNQITSEKISRTLAMLPEVKGDGDSWCLLIQKILVAINLILTDAFKGFEEEKKNSEVMNMIVPPGKDLPSPLGGQRLRGEVSESATRRLSELLAPRVTTLMNCCCIMLTSQYSFELSIPASPLIATVERVLQVDGSLRGSLFPLTTSLHQELLCAELPSLHLNSLNLLIAIIKCLKVKLLAHAVIVVRFLTEYFQRARIPSIREKVYDIVRMVLTTNGGVGVFPSLYQEVINNAVADLTDNLELGGNAMLSNKQSSIKISVSESCQKNYHKNRKRAKIIPAEHSNGVDLSIKACSKKSQAPLSLKTAALKALNALLTRDDSSSFEHWRPGVDCLVITVATNACDAGWANEERPFTAFQLAALKALLASLLSTTKTQPSYLSQGVDLFRRGKQETGSKISEFCAHALHTLRPLSHFQAPLPVGHLPPRNLSVDEGFNQRSAGRTFSNSIKTNFSSFPKSDLEVLDEDEEVSNIWFENNDGHTFSEGRNLNVKSDETSKKQCSNASEDMMRKHWAIINAEVSHHVLENENNVEMTCLGRDETSVDEEKTIEFRPRRNKSFHDASPNKADFERENSAILVTEMAACKTVSPWRISTNTSNHGNHAPNHLSVDDADSVSLDSLPDIVDGDPDSE